MSDIFDGFSSHSGGFRCIECSKVFSKRFSLQRHFRVVHLNERPHLCKCGKSFATKEQISRHFIAKHTDSKPYPCEKGCEKAFASSNARSYHYKVYHDLERFLCPFAGCFKAFTSRKYLQSHMTEPHDHETELANQIKNENQAIESLRKEVEVLKQANQQLSSIINEEKDFSFDSIIIPLDKEEEEAEEWVKFLKSLICSFM